jgi:NAD(P)-dependent dehydrogenase (short-subunit alcohol dehydrogenase family)
MRAPERDTALTAGALADDVDIRVRRLDVTDPASIDAVVAEADAHGGVDVLVNNAGFQIQTPVEHATDAELQRQFDTNVFGVVRMCRAVLPGMRAQSAGRIINVSSVVGLTGSPYEALYSASKWALEGLSESLAFEVAPFGIKVVIVQPGGGIVTAFTDNAVVGEAFATDSPYRDGFDRFETALHDLAPDVPRDPNEVADAIYTAATVEQPAFRYPVGVDITEVARLRGTRPFEDFATDLQSMLDWHP